MKPPPSSNKIDPTLYAGQPYPLGATLTRDGVNFAVFSSNATHVDLCLFDKPEDGKPSRQIRIFHCTNQIWHLFVPGLKAGQCYGYRVDGAFEPSKGHRFNPSKLLLDPYAKAISGGVKWDPAMFSYRMGDPQEDLSRDENDNAAFMPKSVVIDPAFDWKGDGPLNTPMAQTVIYETHIKGFSKLWNVLPENVRGTYLGLGSPQAIEYFKKLGITAVEVLPVHHRIDSQHLNDKGLSDYWGYNSIGFFAPDSRFASAGLGQQVTEFKTMVRNLHAAGIEVILDVVYNHTSEGNHLGPTLSFRGLDNAVYYRLTADNPRYYMDYTGTGNTLAVYLPNPLQMVMDSLRYWIKEMHVDGFRFDLAAALVRELHDVNQLSSFFDVIHQDPLISQVKLIAEPWDLGQDGYLVGKFPVLWSEWNGKYRDTVRRYWKGDEGTISEMANRLSGSADLYKATGRTPHSSVNFITSHDGFTLADLVSYQDTHNEANGEDNRDGDKNNNSWNCGAEGATDDPQINALRRRQQRNFLTTLFISQGVPMLAGGDEYGRTQNGNNNAYCQDSEISWLKWERDEHAARLTAFVSKLAAFREKHPVLRRLDFFRGKAVRGSKFRDVIWLNAEGKTMTDAEWNSHHRCMEVFLSGHLTGIDGGIIHDDFFLICLNAHHEKVTFALPAIGIDAKWERLLDTADEDGFLPPQSDISQKFEVEGRSLSILRLKAPESLDRASVMGNF
jgi:glycogen operon protein